MDDGETQDSSTMSSSSAENVSSSLPKMHSLVQCGTDKYWEVEASCVNWIRFIKADPGPIFESQTSSGDASTLFATIALTEPRAAVSDGGPGMEMIIQLEVCFLTGIGHLLAVRTMENSHGALYAMRDGLPVKRGTLLAHQKLHLMRPGDRIGYVQDGDELIMEYKYETVVETSDSQNLARESLSYLDQTQDTDIPVTQQFAQKSQGGVYFTQEQQSFSQASALQESNDISKADQHSQQPNENSEVLDDAILSQASSGDTTVDPTEIRDEKLPSQGIESLKHAPKSSPVRDEMKGSPGQLAPESSTESDDEIMSQASSGDTTVDPTEPREEKLSSQGMQSVKHTSGPPFPNASFSNDLPKDPESLKRTPESLQKKETVRNETEEGLGILAPESLEEVDAEILSQASSSDATVDPNEVRDDKLPLHGIQSLKHTDESSPARDEMKEIPGLLEPAPSKAVRTPEFPLYDESKESLGLLAPESSHETLINGEPSKITESMKHSPESLLEKRTRDRDEIKENSGLLKPELLHKTLVDGEPSQGTDSLKHTPRSLCEREIPVHNGIEESSSLLAPESSMHTTIISNELPKDPETLKHTPESLQEREHPGRDEVEENPCLFARKSLHTAETHVGNENEERARPLGPEFFTSNQVEESPGLYAPTQPLNLLDASTKDQPSHPTLPDGLPSENRLTRTPRRKRALVQMVGSGRSKEEVTPLKECDYTPARMTRSKTVGTQPSAGKKVQKPRILVTGIEVDSIIEALVSKVGGTLIQDLTEANTATHVVAKDLKRTTKLMIGLCCTNKIVTLDWLRMSAENEKPLPCNNFLVIDTKLFNTITKNLQKGKVLEQHTVHFCKSITKPPPDECRLMVEAAGGSISPDLSLLSDKAKKQLLIIRKGSSFLRGEKDLCTSCVDGGATVWTLDEFLNVMVTQSRP